MQRVQVALFKLALPFADKIIFLNSDDVKDLLHSHSIPVRHYEVLGGIGLKLDDYPYQPVNPRNNETNFLFIGRLLKEKGIFDFIEAAKIVKQRYPNTKFTVLGNIDADNPGALHSDQVQKLGKFTGIPIVQKACCKCRGLDSQERCICIAIVSRGRATQYSRGDGSGACHHHH